MNQEQFLAYHKEMCDKLYEIAKSKNHDYSGSNESAFANFEIVGLCGIASVEQGFLTRIMDKISRINSFIKQGILEVEDEKITDTCADAANYFILLSAYLKTKKQ